MNRNRLYIAKLQEDNFEKNKTDAYFWILLFNVKFGSCLGPLTLLDKHNIHIFHIYTVNSGCVKVKETNDFTMKYVNIAVPL